MDLTFKQLTEANLSRVSKWHSLESWSPLEWAGAMAGEAGEACNAAKKLKRIQTGMPNITDRESTEEEARQKVLKEVADTVIYGALLCSRVGGDLESAVREVFNQKSEEYGFPERL